jgi:hypothetical protein
MTAQNAAITAVVALFLAIAGVALMLTGPGDTGSPTPAPAPGASAASPAAPGRTIKVRLFYVSEDGTRLTSVERDVPFAEGSEQAREIVAAQIAPVAAPLVSAAPPSAVLRAVYVTDRGDAYVDFGPEMVTAHPGGTLNELLTIYSIVNALTVNLPGIRLVQILIDGKEVETLAGHVDLRQPLAQNLGLVQ